MEEEPSQRKSVIVPPANAADQAVREEVGELFGAPSAPAQSGNADDFISKTQRSKVAIIVPMFGYWQDVKDGFLDDDVLDAATHRARSYAHNYYVILLAEPQRLPISAAKVINSKYVAGNARGIAMPNGSSYGDYLRKGVQVALTETDAKYIVFVNPWVVMQDHGVDTLIDRINIPDNAPVICGYDMRDKLTPEDFLTHKANAPEELKALTFNFFGMDRFIAEMCPIDPTLRTQAYLERDFFMAVAAKGYSSVSSEKVPIYSFSVDWRQYIPAEDYEHDKQEFLKKWRFVPDDIKYE